MQTIGKPWGKEEILEVNDHYVVKRLHIKSGKRCSLQYHEKKTETIYLLDGVLLLHINDETIILENPGAFHTILSGEIHRMEGGNGILYSGCILGSGIEPTIYLECSTIELDDVVRVEDDYGRE